MIVDGFNGFSGVCGLGLNSRGSCYTNRVEFQSQVKQTSVPVSKLLLKVIKTQTASEILFKTTIQIALSVIQCAITCGPILGAVARIHLPRPGSFLSENICVKFSILHECKCDRNRDEDKLSSVNHFLEFSS
jgi:hypothetical protein